MLTPDQMSSEALVLYQRLLHTDIIANHKYDLNSRVTKFYDYMADELPEELSTITVIEDEIDSMVEKLRLKHLIVEHPEAVAEGDSVKCKCLSDGKYHDRPILLYPGLELPGAERAEKDVLGVCVGVPFDTEIGEEKVKLVIEEISRQSNTVVNDALVQTEGLKGVATVEAYRDWCRKEIEEKKKEALSEKIAAWFFQNFLEKAEIYEDEQEKQQWAIDRAKLWMEMDRSVTAEDSEKYNAELNERIQDNLEQFRGYIAQIGIANAGGIHYGPEETAARIVESVTLFDIDYSDYEGVMAKVNMTYFMEVVYLECTKEILKANAMSKLKEVV